MAFGDKIASAEISAEPFGSAGPFDLSLDLTGVDLVVVDVHVENMDSNTTTPTVVRDPATDNESFARVAAACNSDVAGGATIRHDHFWLDVSAETGTQTLRVTTGASDVRRYVIHGVGYEGEVDAGSPEAAVSALALTDDITTVTNGALVHSWGGAFSGSPNTGELFAASAPGGLVEHEDGKIVVGGASGSFVQATAGQVTVTWAESSDATDYAIGVAAYAPAATGTTENMSATVGLSFGMSGDIDTTAPTLSNPIATVTGTTTATVTVTTNEVSDVYVVVTTSSTTPSAAQIESGQDHTGASAVYDNSNLDTAPGTIGFPATGLAAGTEYYAHFWAEDASGNSATPVSSAAFRTDTPISATVGLLFGVNPDIDIHIAAVQDIPLSFGMSGSMSLIENMSATVGMGLGVSGNVGVIEPVTEEMSASIGLGLGVSGSAAQVTAIAASVGLSLGVSGVARQTEGMASSVGLGWGMSAAARRVVGMDAAVSMSFGMSGFVDTGVAVVIMPVRIYDTRTLFVTVT